MNKIFFTILIVVIIAGLLFFIISGSINKKGQTILYYGNTCPHCKEVRDWMNKQQIDKKITIIEKEVYDNPVNSLEMVQSAKKCGLPEKEIGVPFLYAGGKCYTGTPEVIDYLSKQAGIKK